MKPIGILFGGLSGLLLLAGCETVPPGVERGPHGTIAYNVQVETSEPGVKIEANGEYVGTTPLTLKIFGDKDGTFHDFGSYYYIVRAYPLHTNEYVQTRVFGTGRHFSHEDRIPQRIYFDMTQPPPQYPAYAGPGYPPPYYYGPPYYYYGPPAYYYGPPVYYGPRFYFRGHFR
ncbi:MAG TPA: hypothetical protein VN578_12875 [Candidatus Binatia bacterium]|jgi:hypothetical protein|nr:hypothetical protein [Candidatus Binatia bacterium]